MGSGNTVAVEPLSVSGCPSMEAVAVAVEGRSGASARLGAGWQDGEKCQNSGAEKRNGFLQW